MAMTIFRCYCGSTDGKPHKADCIFRGTPTYRPPAMTPVQMLAEACNELRRVNTTLRSILGSA